jgi:chorismate synthase
MLSLPASKGFEIGSGFAGKNFFWHKISCCGNCSCFTVGLSTSNLFPGTDLTGSEHNDEFYMDEAGNVRTRTNRSGGVQVFILTPIALALIFSTCNQKYLTDC